VEGDRGEGRRGGVDIYSSFFKGRGIRFCLDCPFHKQTLPIHIPFYQLVVVYKWRREILGFVFWR
jgi:hypothetical protein